MEEEKREKILEKMMAISELIEQNLQDEKLEVGNISYHKNFNFGEEKGIFIARIENQEESITTYEIYSESTNTLIATVDEQGKLHAMPEYIEALRDINPELARMFELENINFEQPKELEEEDIVLTKNEREHILQQREIGNQEKKKGQESSKEEKRNEEEIQEKTDKLPEEEEQEQIAEQKGIPTHSVLLVRENSNFYYDHPNLEKNLFFYRDKDGVVRAEYLDENGRATPSKYFKPSTTSLRQETVSLGDDGNPVTKEVPYQVMRTEGLNNIDKDIKDVRINIKIDTYGYLDIEESRQGKNGDWLSHDIEVKGRSYNSHAVNESTSIRSRKADPDRQTEAYEMAENSGLEEEGIQYNEMYLVSHADEFIDKLIKEGYQRKEAVDIFNYMIGEEALTLREAKERVNSEIERNKTEKENEHEETRLIEDDDEERTPWGDAEAREKRTRG